MAAKIMIPKIAWAEDSLLMMMAMGHHHHNHPHPHPPHHHHHHHTSGAQLSFHSCSKLLPLLLRITDPRMETCKGQ